MRRLTWGWLPALAIAVVVVVLVSLLPAVRRAVAVVFGGRTVQRAVLDVMRSDEIKFLVTDRLVTQVMVESDTGNAILGTRKGHLLGTARLYYGMDLSGLGEDDMTLAGGVLTVRMPEPRELDFAVDMDSLRFVSKRSGLTVIADWALDRNQESELRRQFKSVAIAGMRSENLIPRKTDILERLNKVAGNLGTVVGVTVVFE